MFTLVQSNQMERLARRLAAELAQGSRFALAREHVLVQSPGMASWLKLEIARHNGIAAALEFPLPSNFIWSLCYALIPGVPKENAFTKEAMTWKLLALLPEVINGEAFGPLRDYLSTDSALKRFQLAGRIADIFDQYLVYRPDWILAWEQGEDIAAQQPYLPELPFNATPVDDNCRWQPILWRALVSYNRDRLGLSHWHRANLHQALITALNDPNTSLTAIPSRLFVFGISSLPPQTLDVLHALGGRIEVTMLSLSPCRQYWGDILDPRQRAKLALRYTQDKMLPAHWEETLEVGNPLLAANGKMGRELLDLVLTLPEQHLDIDDSEYASVAADTLLGTLQADILDMQVAGTPLCATLSRYQQQEGKLLLRDDDQSLVIHSCHSALREVETLHDHLLAMLTESEGALSPRDIVVMLPDVAAYAPFIDAVFASKRGEHYIPYAIADRGAADESPLVHAFLTLLDIDDSRFGLTEILSLLEVPAVLTRFKLTEEELSRLTVWLEQSGVRWGRDADSREAMGLPAFDKHSWAFGIRRILLGYALGDDADFYQHTLPLSGVEGAQAQCVGKLLDFIEVLDNFSRNFREAETPADKFERLFALLDTLFVAGDDSLDDLTHIRELLTQTREMLSTAGSLDNLPLAVFKSHLSAKLTESRVGQRFLAGSVNFCTLMPMRSIPFRLVCLLGMNDGVYPRVQHPVGFDLMARTGARRGDRSRRLDDRYLFLEALLSARQQLYISFIGRSERDDSERPPSILVSELLDCCELSACLPGLDETVAAGTESERNEAKQNKAQQGERTLQSRLIRQQPLQPFDPRLFSPSDSIGQSFAAQWCPAKSEPARPFVDGELEPVETASAMAVNMATANTGNNIEELELGTLIRFFREPARFFCQRRLLLDLSLRLDALDDAEPFELDALERYQVQLEMMNRALGADEKAEPMVLDALGERLGGEGILPMAPFDALTYKGYCRDLAPVLERSRFLMAGHEPKTLRLSIPLPGGAVIVGKLDNIFPKGLLVTRPGTAKAKDILALYLRHLCLCASGHGSYSFLLDVGHFHAMAPVPEPTAVALLAHLTGIYHRALSRPSRLIPAMALGVAEAYIGGDAHLDADGSVAPNASVDPNASFDANASLDADASSLSVAMKEALLPRLAELWEDGQGFGESNEPHNSRLFEFPADFLNAGFVAEACGLWLPLLAICHSEKLGKLGEFIESPASVPARFQTPGHGE
ncbi:exodeoxyribonuclease V subunit gamma [Shewanella sp. JM162201]|uniref:RecBCD enzyme subunit RecC n=1 Tax=Shewanella jiangmenensis TaxID=2837387 RepID=A0ABS5V6L0_9GAMM|nr:exodeoxyribonuclease V subunit gamma [Shewanella jiangmenensis]MBT1445550.1 exodeoxyribonuclease V subunit gamma [Shewanella jiangmenensis]